jgi:hypothetical protein
VNARRRQIAWILGARRRQVERELKREGFQEAASSAEGHDTECKLFDVKIKVVPGDGEFIAVRARTATLASARMKYDPNPPIGWAVVVTDLKVGREVAGVGHKLIDAARQNFGIAGSDFGPYEFVVTRDSWRMIRHEFEQAVRGPVSVRS